MQPVPDTFRCPTCGAVQPWSATCRRCKSDLGLLRAAADEYRHSHERCLAELGAGRTRVALAHARRCWHLRPDGQARGLLAVCALLDGDWPGAWAIAEQEARESDRTAPIKA